MGFQFVSMELLFVFNHLDYALAALTTLLCLIQLAYIFLSYARPIRKGQSPAACTPASSTEAMPVSVIVYTKNETENLHNHLPLLLEQEYPQFEVIVINDGSTDESNDVLKRFEHTYKHLYHTYIPEDTKYLSRKKLSLTVGIKAARYETLLFTEANCRPASPHWIAQMMTAYSSEKTKIVLGFSSYPHHKGFFHKQVAYDNLVRGAEYLSSALKHHPYAGNGYNLSYKKELFFAHKGYSKFLNLQAGDDDLFINEVATPTNTEVVFTPESLTYMTPIDYFGIWKEMKAARAATRKEYKGSQIYYYRCESFLFFLYLTATLATLAVGFCSNWLLSVWAVLLYLVRYLSKGFVFNKLALLLGQHSPMIWLPILEITTPLFGLYIYIYRLFRGKKDYTFRLGNER